MKTQPQPKILSFPGACVELLARLPGSREMPRLDQSPLLARQLQIGVHH